jgi:hypothetical protein
MSERRNVGGRRSRGKQPDTRLLFLDGFVVCPVVAGLHTALRQIGRFRVDCMISI